MRQQQLPLWEKIVFVDWHGVMSTDRFWESVLIKKTRLAAGLRIHLSRLFSSDSDLIDAWMRGEITTSEVVAPTQRYLGARRGHDFLERRIIEDCRLMTVDAELASLLASLLEHALVVLATDNTVEFEETFRASQRTVLAPSAAACLVEPTLDRIAPYFDDILCSATLGVLKADDPQRFFGSWISANSLRFCDSLLIDDRADNCERFRDLGGNAILWDDSVSPRSRRLSEIREFVRSDK